MGNSKNGATTANKVEETKDQVVKATILNVDNAYCDLAELAINIDVELDKFNIKTKEISRKPQFNFKLKRAMMEFAPFSELLQDIDGALMGARPKPQIFNALLKGAEIEITRKWVTTEDLRNTGKDDDKYSNEGWINHITAVTFHWSESQERKLARYQRAADDDDTAALTFVPERDQPAYFAKQAAKRAVAGAADFMVQK